MTARPAELRLDVLGPLRICRDSADVAVGPRQQRLLLALLLVRAGRLVELAEITDLIWGEDPPPTAVNMVHRYVGAVRRLLEPGLPDRAGGRWIVREAGGYRFDPAGAEVDLVVFRDHVHRAGQLTAAGDDEAALGSLIAALDRWRGRCGAGLGPSVQTRPDFAAVDREYVVAAREAAGAARRCGRGGQVLPALREAARRYPLDEALQAELLLVLAADGQHAEAVALFDEIRTRLTEELGISPGPELAGAYDAVLRPAVTDPRARTGTRVVPPAQLPSDLSLFTGRDEAVRSAGELLTRTHPALPILAFTGMPGIGKSTLAVHVAHRVAGHFPDGQLYADLHGFDARGCVAAPGDVLESFLEALGVEQAAIPPAPDARAALFRSVVAGRRLLVLLDNARDADQVRPLLPGTAGHAVLVTSRSPLAGLATAGALVRNLDVPSMAEARAGMIERVGHRRAAREPAALDAVIRWCGRLPLAMAIVCARAAAHPEQSLADLAKELRHTPRNLDTIADEDLDHDVRAVFSWSYRLLSADAARLFRLLPLHPGPDVTVEVAAGLGGRPLPEARAHLAELVRTGLVSRYRPTRYRLHDLLRAYAGELGAELDTPAERDAARQRVLEHYLHTTAGAVELVRPGYTPFPLPPVAAGVTPQALPDEAAVMAWSARERRTLLAVVDEAAERGSAGGWRLALLAKDLFHRHGWWPDWADMCTVVLAAAERAGDLEGMAHSHRALAVARHHLGDPDAAAHHLKAAHELFDATGDALGRSLVRMNLGYMAHQRGEQQSAITDLEEALDAFRRLRQPQLEAVVLATLAEAYLAAGDEPRSRRLAERAAHLCCELRDAWNGTRAATTLARIHRRHGRFVTAIRLHQHCIDLLRRRTAVLEVAHHRIELGDTLVAAGDVDGARQVWTTVLRELTDEPAAPPAVRARQRLAGHGR